MNRSEDQVARLGCPDGRLEGFLVTHLAHQHYVGILSDQGPQCLVEVEAVDADLSLVDRGLDFSLKMYSIGSSIVTMWQRLTFIDVLQHGGDRRALAAIP